MNNKGFTLIELIATIAILAVIMLIAIPSVTNLAESIKRSHYKNIVKNIEIASKKYAEDTLEEAVYVDTLIKLGYLKSDEDDHLKNPLNNENLNCYMVKLEKVNDYYEAKMSSESYENNGVCDENELNSQNRDITINVLNNGSIVDSENWLKGNVTLEIASKNIQLDCENNKCIWASTRGFTKEGSSLNITSDNVINAIYNFQYLFNEDDNLKRYQKSITLKIDNEKPVIELDKIVITDPNIETENKNVTLVASDGIGSGIDGYYLGNNVSSCASVSYSKQNKFLVNSNGNYLICVKDAVGNVNSAELKIENIKN